MACSNNPEWQIVTHRILCRDSLGMGSECVLHIKFPTYRAAGLSIYLMSIYTIAVICFEYDTLIWPTYVLLYFYSFFDLIWGIGTRPIISSLAVDYQYIIVSVICILLLSQSVKNSLLDKCVIPIIKSLLFYQDLLLVCQSFTTLIDLLIFYNEYKLCKVVYICSVDI